MSIITRGATRRAVLVGGLVAGAAAAVGSGLRQALASEPMAPAAPRDDAADSLYGRIVADPFRPLEDPARADVQAWIEWQDARARDYVAMLKARGSVRAFLDAVASYPRTSIPARFGARYFTLFNDGLANQRSVGLYEHLGGPRRTLLDPNPLSADGTIGIANIFPDRRGTKFVYLLSESGSDRQKLRVREVETAEDLPDTLEWCKHTSVAWLPDGRGFVYSRYPADWDPAGWNRRGQIVCLHRLGQPQSEDRVIFRLPAARDVYFRLLASYESELLKITAGIGTSEKAGYYVAPFSDLSRIMEIFPIDTAGFVPIANLGPTHYALTNLAAPKWRLVRIDQSDPKPDRWHTVIAESDAALDYAAVFDSHLLVKRIDNVNHRISIHDLTGEERSVVDLGGLARVIFGRYYRNDDHLLLEVEDYRRPARIEWLDLASGRTSTFRKSAARHDLSDVVVRQVFVMSRDGTRLPMTLIHRPDIALDNSNRTLLYGYGGFGYAIWPGYRDSIAAWVRMGGVYAIASIRGGGEYGQPWHDAGRLARKQNSFDDFIASAQWLIDNGITRPDRLGSNGASNGGLLVLACMLQRPNLWGAVVSAVPVTDMLRFKKFTFGINWTPEYGDPDKSEADFNTLIGYSPLHNIRPGTKYPPLLILTADHHDRVVPAHSYKFAAAMQSACPDSAVYLRVERRAGHGQGNALNKLLDRESDTLAFLSEKLGGPLFELPRIPKE
jgi:prolyl oligopeptidase